MKHLLLAISVLASIAGLSYGQGTFEVTGTPIPAELLRQNYGAIPKNVTAFDLNICNITDSKQSIVSSKIYQALTKSDSSLEPIGRQIMLAAILRNQNRSAANVMNYVLSSLTGVISIVRSSKYNVPAGVMEGAALASLSGQQLMTSLKPMLTIDQVEKFEGQVLEPALVLDSGSCVERTVFATAIPVKANASSRANAKSGPTPGPINVVIQ